MNKKWEFKIEAELIPLLPEFIKNRRDDFVNLGIWLEALNFLEIARLGHNLQGAPGAFGIKDLVTLGVALETASNARDVSKIKDSRDELEDFLGHYSICPTPDISPHLRQT